MPDQTSLVVFDVNETLSDMAPLAERFAEVGADRQLAGTWFSGLLRDGFALTVTDSHPVFAELAEESLRVVLSRAVPSAELDDAARYVFEGIAELDVHPDVVPAVHALVEAGLRLVTLTVGGAEVADRLLKRAGVRELFEATLSAADAGRWKPHQAPYKYALDTCGVPAAEALLVAVHPWDIDGAHRAGLRTAWVDRAGTHYPGYFSAPDIVVDSLEGLIERL